MRWPERLDQGYLLDPCAGDGEAIAGLRDLWHAELDALPHRLGRRAARLAILAGELERDRAQALRGRLDQPGDAAFHADAFRLFPSTPAATGATLLYLNPPYDHDPTWKRLEHRFLVRFTEHLHPGAGHLLYLVPDHVLAVSAAFLAEHFLDLRAWRLPDADYERFRQVLLVGRRARRSLLGSAFAETIRRWGEEPSSLPTLPERCPDPCPVEAHPDPPYSLRYTLEREDLTPAVRSFRLWTASPGAPAPSARELVGARFETAVPPKPAHIALALSSGLFNGHRLEPNDPRRDPPILAKGTFQRRWIEVDEKTDADGEVTAVVEIEQPQLELSVLRLDDYTFHSLAPGTVPTGAPELAKWNAADLITRYDRALVRLLGQQFPAIHDPSRSDHRIGLPGLARRPFRAQAEAAQAALKLLARGRNPFLVAEVGTGKSTMALTIAAALSPAWQETTLAELRRLGFPAQLPTVRKTLILCPPHLLKSWTDQVAAVLPRACVAVLRTLGDLSRDADVYILSRETAKLGHAYRGVLGHCPRCGRPSDDSPTERAARRLRCTAVDRRPIDAAARLAEALATILAPALPEDARVRSALRGHALTARLSGIPRPLAFRLLHSFLDSVLDEFRATALREDSPYRLFSNLLRTLPRLASALDASERVLDSLRDLTRRADLPEGREFPIRGAIAGLLEARRAPDMQRESTASLLLEVLEILLAEGTWRAGEVCDEPLYQAEPTPRRYPLARYILRHHASDFDLLILDEAHEFNHAHSAQAHAAHRLCRLSGVPTIVLTGSLMGGYASSLFANFQALSPLFRDEFSREDLPSFLATYGYRKALRRIDDDDTPRRRGRNTDRHLDGRKILGEAPGIHPTFILRHLLPTAVLVHKSDLDEELPSLAEIPSPVAIPKDDDLSRELLGEYERLRDRLLDRIKADRFVKGRAGRLLGALVELPSYLDRATDDLETFCLRYPRSLGRELIDCGRSFPAGWRTPKERWLEAELCEARRRGERVLVFLRHSGSAALPERLLSIAREVTSRVAWLDAGKVSAPKREAWIDRHVLAQGVEVLLVNPNAVRTGLNNLVSFSTALWYELDYSATTYRQANGRLHRIGQLRPVTVKTAYYPGTAQEIAFELVAKKVTASLQVDGLDIQAALEAAGAGADQAAARAAAMSLGQAVYRALTGEALQPSAHV